jgi:hypothetical protein
MWFSVFISGLVCGCKGNLCHVLYAYRSICCKLRKIAAADAGVRLLDRVDKLKK